MFIDIKCVHAQYLLILNLRRSLRIKTAPRRESYVRDVYISNVTRKNVSIGIIFTGLYGEHPIDRYDLNALPYVKKIKFKDILGDEIKIAGSVEGIQNAHSKIFSYQTLCLMLAQSLSVNVHTLEDS